MARFKAGDANKYGGQGGGGFFQINEDKGVKQVRLLYDSVDDIQGDSVHKIKLGEKDRYVNCLREYNDPIDSCPFCKAHIPVQARLFVPLYNMDDDEVQIWDRGKTMFQKLVSVCERATKKGSSIVNHIFEIERNGKPKDKKTTYEIYDTDEDDTELSEFTLPNIIGPKGLVLDKSADDMEYFLESGEFPPVEDDSDEDETPVRRRGADREDSRREESRDRGNRDRAGRRTPASSRKEDEF